MGRTTRTGDPERLDQLLCLQMVDASQPTAKTGLNRRSSVVVAQTVAQPLPHAAWLRTPLGPASAR